MADQLTDLDGIGAKTAEDLREQGIDSVEDLQNAYLSNSPRVRGSKRLETAARESLFEERGEFTDPASGATVTEDDRFAFERLASRRVGDLSSVNISGSNPSVSPDDQVRDFIPAVQEGRFDRDVGGDRNLLGFAADAAASLDADELDSGELQDVNEAASQTREELTLRKANENFTTTSVQGTVEAGGLFRALAKHERRSEKAQRVDERRDATDAEDYEQWSSDPSRYDYPGVDSPVGLSRLFPEERTKRNRAGFGSSTLPNSDRGQLKSTAETVSRLNEEQERRVFGETGVADVAEEIPKFLGGDEFDE
jgi:hypothetical protein